MSRTVIGNKNRRRSVVKNFLPNICGDFILGRICALTFSPVYKRIFQESEYTDVVFPYEMDKETAWDTSSKIDHALIHKKEEIEILYKGCITDNLFDGSLDDFRNYMKDFAEFLKVSEGYTCI
jgi:hypothetical protein